jgi:hypothetical protein
MLMAKRKQCRFNRYSDGMNRCRCQCQSKSLPQSYANLSIPTLPSQVRCRKSHSNSRLVPVSPKRQDHRTEGEHSVQRSKHEETSTSYLPPNLTRSARPQGTTGTSYFLSDIEIPFSLVLVPAPSISRPTRPSRDGGRSTLARPYPGRQAVLQEVIVVWLWEPSRILYTK